MVHLRSFIREYLALFLAAGGVNAQRNAWMRYPSVKFMENSDNMFPLVSFGSEIHDSPNLRYEGKWTMSRSDLYFSGSSRKTRERGASFSLSFSGTGIEWLGECDRFHGHAQINLDGEEEEVNLFCDTAISRKQQRLFYRSDLEDGKHTIKIVNLGQLPAHKLTTSTLDIDALVVTLGYNLSTLNIQKPLMGLNRNLGRKRRRLFPTGEGSSRPRWNLVQRGTTGVNAMQLAVVSSTHAIIIDKVEHNPLNISGHGAWGALYNLNTDEVQPLEMKSNSFCAGGTFLSNGTLLNIGGNGVDKSGFDDSNGLQAIRLFQPCDSESGRKCEIYENPSRIHMASPRWYPTAVRLDDGSAIIIGGSMRGDYINNPDMNNPTYEFWPPKAIHGSNGMPIPMRFLRDTLNANLFPMAFLLPDGKLFIAANTEAMIYNWRENTEQRLPSLPNGVRVTYPMTGVGLLLPLSPENDYTPEVLICGGSTLDDKAPPQQLSSQDSASAQCAQMVLTEQGISRGWQVEQMPEPRVMPDAVILPTGEIVIVNGAKSGVAGYQNVKQQVGQSNADNPVFTPVVYDPHAPDGKRFYRGDYMPTSSIPRLYHSVATLTPRGDIMIAGSNPNFDRSEVKYATEYRVEWLSPPYMQLDRPVIKKAPHSVEFGDEFVIRLDGPVKEGQQVKGMRG